MSFQPSFVIDISDQIETKMQAVACYKSQRLHEAGIAEMVKTLNGYFGGRIDVKYAEPFFSHEVLGLTGIDQIF